MKNSALPEAVRRRLSQMKFLTAELERQGRDRVTSRELGRWLGATGATVRKDLSWLTPGSSGAAYETPALSRLLRDKLDLSRAWKTALAGLGEQGLFLASELHSDSSLIFELCAGFDSRANRLEQLDLPVPLYPTTEITSVSLRLGLEAAVLAVAASEAQKVADRFIQGGVRILVNYTSVLLRVNRNQVLVRECGLFTEDFGTLKE